MFKPLIIICILANFLIDINALECTLLIGGEAPRFTKQFRKRTITLPRNGNTFVLKSGEKINAHCSEGLILSTPYPSEMNANEYTLNVEIGCNSNGFITFKKLNRPQSSYLQNTESPSVVVSCERGMKVYESETALKGCENYTSFGIGTILQDNKQIISAAICFNFDTMTTKYVKYLAGRPNLEVFNENFDTEKDTPKAHIIDLDTPMENFEILFNELNANTFEAKYKEMQRNIPFLSSQEFEYVSLVQDKQLRGDLANFEYFLNTVWWRNLRLGNWKLFLSALKRRTENVKYIIYTGTSGQLRMPSILGCRESELFQIKNFDSSFQVPEIIWAYVKPVITDERDEFVVFGYNTPFYSSKNETIICKNICNEIDWLRNDDFGRIRLFPAFGVVHCCRPEEVASQLDIFPMEKLSKNPTEEPLILNI